MTMLEVRSRHRKWQDSEGNDRYTSEVVANTFRLLERRESNGNSYPVNMRDAKDAPPVENKNVDAKAPVTTQEGGDAVDDDLPF